MLVSGSLDACPALVNKSKCQPGRSVAPLQKAVGIWQLGQYLQHRVAPLLCLLTVLWPLQWPILLLHNYYCLAIV